MRDIYRVGGATHSEWVRALAEANQTITERDALISDPDDGWTGVDPTKLPADFVEHYTGLCHLGFWHGWVEVAA